MTTEGFFLFLIKTICCAPHLNRLNEMVQKRIRTYAFMQN